MLLGDLNGRDRGKKNGRAEQNRTGNWLTVKNFIYIAKSEHLAGRGNSFLLHKIFGQLSWETFS